LKSEPRAWRFPDSLSPEELYGLGFDHSDKDDAKYEAVALDDVKRAAAKMLISAIVIHHARSRAETSATIESRFLICDSQLSQISADDWSSTDHGEGI
jgi:hypothetical protein